MKSMNTSLLLLVGIVFFGSTSLFAQTHEDGVPYRMAKITDQLSEQLNDIPANIRRIAVYKMNYSALRFTVQEIDYIRSEIEASFRQFAGLTVLSPPELEPNDKMKIMGNDSTLQILNIQGRSLADVSPEFLTTITDKYGVQGLVELSIQRRTPEGLVISVRMMNPNSREIVWTKSFISNPFVVEEEFDKGQPIVLKFGAGNRQTESFFRADTSFANQDTSINANITDFNFSLTYRQPLNEDNSAYIGYTGGITLLNARDAEEFELTLLQLGITYYQGISQKNESINDYRVMFFVNANVQFPIDDTKGEIFSASPGLMLNLSRNLGISFYSNLILSGETLTLGNNNQITYNKVGYGLHAVVRF